MLEEHADSGKEKMFSFAAVGNRLYKIRHVAGFGHHQQKWAEQLGFPVTSYSHWETGRMPLPVPYALRIRDEVPGLSLDYIYTGNLDFLTIDLSRRLRAAPDRPPTRPGRRPKRSK